MRSMFRLSIVFVLCFLFVAEQVVSQKKKSAPEEKTVMVGVASVDITPEFPIRLAGYGAREHAETDSVFRKLEGKAMAFGADAEHPSVLITVDLLGITAGLRARVTDALQKQAGIDPAQVVICASHTHGGPEIGNAINVLFYREETPTGYTDSILPLDHLAHIAEYRESLVKKLIDVSLTALKKRQPSFMSWGQGQAYFAWNRRPKSGPVDVALPILKITDAQGNLKGVFLNYACHGTTFEGINVINADWIGEAKRIIEERHPGALALVALGCGADADPKPRGHVEDVIRNGTEIADNVDKLLASELQPLTIAPSGKLKWVQLPFAKVPTVEELIEAAKGKPNTLIPYYARVALEQVVRGETIPGEVSLPIQVWNFGPMAMVNLGGEVVVDYELRLKQELGAEHLWVNGYSNDVPCYIASKRVIREGGYEAETSMPCYHKPSPLSETVEEIIINAVHEIIPSSFAQKRDTANRQETVSQNSARQIRLAASKAAAIGPSIKYMPEWKAFGWFTTEDRSEWNVNIQQSGKYDVYIDYSVSDDEAGKHFLLESGNKKIKGKIAKTGSWFTYALRKIGTVSLSAGEQKWVYRSDHPGEKGAMLDLREIIFVPAGADPHQETESSNTTVLFDGKNLDRWVGNKTDYIVEDGLIALHPENHGKGNLYTEKEYGDFEFTFEFKLPPGGNNGIGIRAPLEGDAAYVGMEIQILDDNAEVYKDLHDYQFHGSVYGVIPAKRGSLKPAGEWNSEQITARDNQITVVLNGRTILDGDIAKASANGTLDHQQHPGLKNKKGHIGLLWHETPIQFRSISVKEL